MALHVKRKWDDFSINEQPSFKKLKLEPAPQDSLQLVTTSPYFHKINYLYTVKALYEDSLSFNEIVVVNTLLSKQLVSCLREYTLAVEDFSQKVTSIYENWSGALDIQARMLFDYFVNQAAKNLSLLLHPQEAQLFSEKNLIDIIRYFFISHNELTVQKFSTLAFQLTKTDGTTIPSSQGSCTHYFISFLEQHIVHQITYRKPTFLHRESIDSLNSCILLAQQLVQEIQKKEQALSLHQLHVLNALSQKVYASLTLWAGEICSNFVNQALPRLNCNVDRDPILQLAIAEYTTACNFQKLDEQEKIASIKSMLLPRLDGFMYLCLQVDSFYLEK